MPPPPQSFTEQVFVPKLYSQWQRVELRQGERVDASNIGNTTGVGARAGARVRAEFGAGAWSEPRTPTILQEDAKNYAASGGVLGEGDAWVAQVDRATASPMCPHIPNAFSGEMSDMFGRCLTPHSGIPSSVAIPQFGET